MRIPRLVTVLALAGWLTLAAAAPLPSVWAGELPAPAPPQNDCELQALLTYQTCVGKAEEQRTKSLSTCTGLDQITAAVCQAVAQGQYLLAEGLCRVTYEKDRLNCSQGEPAPGPEPPTPEPPPPPSGPEQQQTVAQLP